MYSCLETICRWFTSSLSVSKSHFSFRKHEPNRNKHIGGRGSLKHHKTTYLQECKYYKLQLEVITDRCSAFDFFIKLRYWLLIVVAQLHSPATSNDQHSSHQTCSMAQSNISVTIPYAREKFNRLWKEA